MDAILNSVIEKLLPGTEFYVRRLDADMKMTGEPIQCMFVQRFVCDYPVILATIGNTTDVSFCHLTTDDVDGKVTVELNPVCESDVRMDYGHPGPISDEWAGSLLAVLD